MCVQFPQGRLLSRGGFLALLKKRYPTMKAQTLISMLNRHIEPIRQKGRANKYGIEQWGKATEWIENRSRAYQFMLEAEFFRSANIMGGPLVDTGSHDSMMAGLEKLALASSRKPQVALAKLNEINFRVNKPSLVAKAKAQKAAVKVARPYEEEVSRQVTAIMKRTQK